MHILFLLVAEENKWRIEISRESRKAKGIHAVCTYCVLLNFSFCLLDWKTARIFAKSSMRE